MKVILGGRELHPKRQKLWEEIGKWQEGFEDRLIKTIGKRELPSKNIISIDQFSKEDMELVFDCTKLFKEFIIKPDKKINLLKGMSQINFFFESSTRTRVSFELAGKHLSIDTINVMGSASTIEKKGETLNDVDRKSTRLNSSHIPLSRMPSSA